MAYILQELRYKSRTDPLEKKTWILFGSRQRVNTKLIKLIGNLKLVSCLQPYPNR